jgi:PEP-CTERM motif
MKRTTLVLAVLFVLVCGAVAAHADTITYTETATASGTLDGTGFTNALVTLMLTGDTTNVIDFGGGLFEMIGTTTVSVAGVGSDTFTDQVAVVANQGLLPAAVGFGDVQINAGILFTQNSGFSTFDLKTSIGPLSGPGEGNFNVSLAFPTVGGTFDMTSVGTVTFTAAESTAVPEPGSLLLLGTGLAGLLGMWKKATVSKST